jgi:hypothetical protein
MNNGKKFYSPGSRKTGPGADGGSHGDAPIRKSKYLFRGHILVFQSPYDNVFTAESQSAQSEFSFSFTAERPANENHHAFGNLSAF